MLDLVLVMALGLDADTFARREAVERALTKAGPLVAGHVQGCSTEARHRVARIHAKWVEVKFVGPPQPVHDVVGAELLPPPRER